MGKAHAVRSGDHRGRPVTSPAVTPITTGKFPHFFTHSRLAACDQATSGMPRVLQGSDPASHGWGTATARHMWSPVRGGTGDFSEDPAKFPSAYGRRHAPEGTPS